METIQHKLQQFDPGMVWLDKDNHILAMNGVAIETLNARPGELIGRRDPVHSPGSEPREGPVASGAVVLSQQVAAADDHDDQHPGAGASDKGLQDER